MTNNLPTYTKIVQHDEIFQAIRDNDLQKVQGLLNSCSVQLINIVDDTNKNNTLLHCAVEENRHDIVQELLLKKWGLNINAQNEDGDTALHVGAKKNYDRLIHLLLKAGATSDVVNNEGETFLDIVRILAIRTRICKNNYQVDISNQPGSSRIVTGQSEEHKITKVDKKDTNLAVDNKKQLASPHLLDKNAKINNIANKNWSSLHVAAHNGELARVRYLL
ncbi:acyl-CoA-binding domain-containing protein 6-like [Ctenocephalides felis]|uniref:acyl-CoA-binding domain-containing protein 6-like n=1 Tax=Ctenocephalides felis TaxID=7515 RepID=UPI000E6E2360|nr:acyl-CoA-binding domain-containing protein 6-like [Ctenocephalides felis]